MYLSKSPFDDENTRHHAISIVSSSGSALKSLRKFFSPYNAKFVLSKSDNQAIDAICRYNKKLLITVIDTQLSDKKCEELSREIRSMNYSLPIIHYTALSATHPTLSINPLLYDGHVTDPLDRENAVSTLERAVLRRQAACRFLGLNFNHVLCDDSSKIGKSEASSPPEDSHK